MSPQPRELACLARLADLPPRALNFAASPAPEFIRLAQRFPGLRPHLLFSHRVYRGAAPEFAMPEGLAYTLGSSCDVPLRKTYDFSAFAEGGGFWSSGKPEFPQNWHFCEVHPRSLEDWASLFAHLQDEPRLCVIRGALDADCPLAGTYRRKFSSDPEAPGPFLDRARSRELGLGTVWLPIDTDSEVLPHRLTYERPGEIVRYLVDEKLPAPFRGASCAWSLSGSAGLATKGPLKIKLHLVFRADAPVAFGAYQDFIRRLGGVADPSSGEISRVMFTARPLLDGGPDPLEGVRRTGVYEGARDTVSLVLKEARTSRPSANVRGSASARAGGAVVGSEGAGGSRNAGSEGSVGSEGSAGAEGYYFDLWKRLGDRIGYGGTGSLGYRKAVYAHACAAFERGERDLSRLQKRLRTFILEKIAALGDDGKQADVERYTSEGALAEILSGHLHKNSPALVPP